jgi:putative DNA primase/helicase
MSGRAIEPGCIPTELRACKQWVCWRPVTRDGKPTKVPYTPDGQEASVTNPASWRDFRTVCAAAVPPRFSGIGFVFTERDPYTGIDLDHVADDGRLSDQAAALVRELASYAELSPSGTGVHIIVRGRKPGGACKRAGYLGPGTAIEIYDARRYLAFTGWHLAGSPDTVNDRQAQLDALYADAFGSDAQDADTPPPVAASPAPASVQTVDDVDLLSRATNAKDGAKFARLYAGDTSDYDGDESAADLALCSLLAFWTQGDASRVDRLFRASGLMRPKWESRRGASTYGAITIRKACAGKSEFYTPRAARRTRTPASGPTPSTAAPVAATARQDGGQPSYYLTDTGNAERLVYQHGRDLRYCYPFGCWFVWDGARWQRDETGAVVQRARQTARSIYGEAGRCDDDAERAAVAKHARRTDHAAPIDAMLRMAQSDVPIMPDDLDRDPWLLNVPNGTIDLRTGALHEHRRDDLITKVAGAAYDPGALCPTFDRFLARVLPDADVRAFVQRAAGYSMTGSVSEQCLFFCHGSGANGKSTLLEALRAVMGDYGHQAAPDLLIAKDRDSIPTGVAALRGARFVATVEVEEGKRLAESLTKQLTGGDRINARFLYQNAFEFDMTGKIWLAANHRPGIRGTDLAIWRRVRMVPFTVSIPEEERDPELLDKLRAEAAGILAWCVAGCLEWQRAGLRPPDAVKYATEQYRMEQDTLGAFIEARCVTGRIHQVKAGDLFAAYGRWCTENGERTTTQTDFGRKLEERGYTRDKRGPYVFRLGIALAGDTLPVDESDPYAEGE